MDLNKLNPLPEWDDERINKPKQDEGDEWKHKEYHQATKALYINWRELFQMIHAFADNLTDNEEDSEDSFEYSNKSLIYENIMKIGPKIMGVVNIDSYVIRMEMAAFIRYNCIEMMEQVGYAVMLGYADASHEEVIKEGLETFQQLFKQWVATFEKDDYEDEWGLFV
jgi:hypothetical protein